MGDYLPSAPVNEEARRNNQNLPGMGGVFNLVNLHVYHYAGNNPVKYVDPDGRITHSQHFNRNQYQNGYAPKDARRMDNLVELGLFKKVGNTGTHNLTPAQNTPEGRAQAVGRSFGTNIDYRGEIGTIFEGMQFIYDSKGNLVLDAVNKGTYDYNSPYSWIPYFSHDGTDIQPWIDKGNGPYADRFSDVVMDENLWQQIDSVYQKVNSDGKITRKEKEWAREQIQQILPPPQKPPNVTPGWED
jgi:hypothetical protein